MTLVEMLVSSALTAAVMAAVLAALGPAQAAFMSQSQRADARQRLRAIGETFTREVMTASAVLPFGRGGVAGDAITLVQGASRRVYYLRDDGQVRYFDGRDSDLPVVDGVSALSFEYIGDAGNIPLASLADGPWLPDAADPARIDADVLRVRLVRIRIAVAGPSPNVEAVLDVSPRNSGREP
jgi:hypothetical protein